MKSDFPQSLEATRELLAGSLRLRASEKAPELPAELLNDLVRRFDHAPVASVGTQSRSWFEAVQSFIARPAFGMTALAIVVIGISVPQLIKPESAANAGGFRGTVSPVETRPDLRIILIQTPSGFEQALQNLGDFETDTVSSVTNGESITGPRVLVDFTALTITAINASEEKIHTAPLPIGVEEISAAIATAISRF